MDHKQVSLNVDEAKDFMRHIIINNKHLVENGKPPVAVELMGDSGIGKTSMILQLGQELGVHVEKLSLSNFDDLENLVGYPLKQFYMSKDGAYEWVDENSTDTYGKQGWSFTGKKKMSYAPPEFVANHKEGIILLLDDYTRADTRFLQATMELIATQKYASWELPKGSQVFMSTNPDNGDYLVNVLDTAQKTRFISVNLKFDIDCWAHWAEAEGIDGRCINFLLMNPEMVTEKINARSITNFFNSISSFTDFSKNLGMIQMIGEGSVGVEFSTMFVLFINNKLDKLISPKTMLMEKDFKKVKETMIDCIGKPYRADIASVLGTRIINFSLLQAKEGVVGKDMLERLTKLTTDDEILHNDIRYFIIKCLLGRESSKFQAIMLDKDVLKMSVK